MTARRKACRHSDAQGIHRCIAADMPALSHLECRSCGLRQHLTRENAAHFLAHGWPVCCNLTMKLWTKREVRALRRKQRKETA